MATNKKVALVTGANRGIGFETARQLGQKGVTVVVAARTLKSAEETASKLKTEGIDAFPVKLDVTNAQDRETAAKTIGDKFGKLDILINNAGVGAQDGMFVPKTVDTTEEELQTVRHQPFRHHCSDAFASPATQKERRRPYRESIQHSWIIDPSRGSEQPDRSRQGLRV